MRRFHQFVAATLLCATCTSAMATDSPLPAGKPAGTKQAAFEGDALIVIVGLAAIGALVAFGASGAGHGNSTPPTSGTGS